MSNIMNKSEMCIQQQHGLCEGNIIQVIDDSKSIRICECECHDNMYKLVKMMQTSNNF